MICETSLQTYDVSRLMNLNISSFFYIVMTSRLAESWLNMHLIIIFIFKLVSISLASARSKNGKGIAVFRSCHLTLLAII